MVKPLFYNEFQLDILTRQKITQLRAAGFPDATVTGRSFFKQLPHYRILLWDNDTLLGHVGIDYRVMNLNGQLIYVFGVIDLVVHPDFQGQGHGVLLMKEVIKTASSHAHHIDFIFLVTDLPAFYQRLGFKSTTITTTWLKIHNNQSYGLGKEDITDVSFMYLPVSGKEWKDGELDLMGYMY